MSDRDFKDVLSDLDEGEVVNQLTSLLPKVTLAVMETGKAGAITLTLKIVKQGGMAVVSADVKTKTPAPALDATMFFTEKDGTLCRHDPRQPELKGLDLHNVRPLTELRAVAGTRTRPEPQSEEPEEPTNPADVGEEED